MELELELELEDELIEEPFEQYLLDQIGITDGYVPDIEGVFKPLKLNAYGGSKARVTELFQDAHRIIQIHGLKDIKNNSLVNKI